MNRNLFSKSLPSALAALVLLLAAVSSPAQIGVTNSLTTLLVTNQFRMGGTTAGTNNAYFITNGGVLVVNTVAGYVGYANANGQISLGNYALISGAGSAWTNTVGSSAVGNRGVQNTLVISNGGVFVTVVDNNIGVGAGAMSNTVVVTGSGSLWTNGRSLLVGNITPYNRLVVRDGARVVSGSASASASMSVGTGGTGASSNEAWILDGSSFYSDSGSVLNMGVNAGANGNLLVVSGNGSSVSNSGNLIIGAGGSFNRFVVSNHAAVMSAGLSIGTTVGTSNLVLVSGATLTTTSTVSTSGINVGNGVGGMGNTLIVSNGAQVKSASAIQIGAVTGSSNNLLLVSGSGTLVSNGSLNVNVGGGAYFNTLVVNDGATLVGGSVRVSHTVGGGSNNNILVSGPGSLLRATALLGVGSNADSGASKGYRGDVLVENGGTLEIGGNLYGGFADSGTISNRSGIFQFLTTSPGVNPGTVNAIVMTDGTISYRGVDGADITSKRITTNIAMRGDSSFRLLDSTNAALAAYAFDSVANTGVSTNFQRLILSGNASRWQSGWLNVGTGGELLVTNAVNATVGANFTNLGSVRVINSTVTWQSNVVLSGSYFSDPSTNTFASNVTVTASGSFSGSNGDLFVFGGNLLNQSTNRDAFSLWQAMVLFTNVAGTSNHVFSLASSLAYDLGTPSTNLSYYRTNFAIGKLSVAAGNFLQLTGQFAGGVSNALYVGALDLGGSTNLLGSLLDLDINLYYDNSDLANAYLNGQTYQLAGWSGSLLPLGGLPIPEPSTIALLGLGALLALRRSRRA